MRQSSSRDHSPHMQVAPHVQVGPQVQFFHGHSDSFANFSKMSLEETDASDEARDDIAEAATLPALAPDALALPTTETPALATCDTAAAFTFLLDTAPAFTISSSSSKTWPKIAC